MQALSAYTFFECKSRRRKVMLRFASAGGDFWRMSTGLPGETNLSELTGIRKKGNAEICKCWWGLLEDVRRCARGDNPIWPKPGLIGGTNLSPQMQKGGVGGGGGGAGRGEGAQVSPVGSTRHSNYTKRQNLRPPHKLTALIPFSSQPRV